MRRILFAVLAIAVLAGASTVMAINDPPLDNATSVPDNQHQVVYARHDDSTLCILRGWSLRVNAVAAMGKIFELAEIGRWRDGVYPHMTALKQLISKQRDVLPANVYELTVPGDTTFHAPWSVGVWICPESHLWINVVATDGEGTIIASADNFAEAKKPKSE